MGKSYDVRVVRREQQQSLLEQLIRLRSRPLAIAAASLDASTVAMWYGSDAEFRKKYDDVQRAMRSDGKKYYGDGFPPSFAVVLTDQAWQEVVDGNCPRFLTAYDASEECGVPARELEKSCPIYRFGKTPMLKWLDVVAFCQLARPESK